MALDDADKKYIADLLKGIVTGEELKKAIGDAAKAHVDAAFKDQETRIDEKIKTATKPKTDEEDPNKGKKGKDGDKTDDATAQELARLKKQVENSEKARKEAEDKSKRENLHNQTQAALIKAGVPAEKVALVLPYLENQGLLSFDKEGKPGWKGKDQYGVDALLPLEDGAAGWVKTDTGKHFLPPTNAQGTGTGSGQRPVNGNGGTVKLSDLSFGGIVGKIQ